MPRGCWNCSTTTPASTAGCCSRSPNPAASAISPPPTASSSDCATAAAPYIAALDIDIVKFDGPAVQGARRSDKGRTFLKALLEVCRDLGIASVFEMVDDEAGLEFARTCGADYVQGYLFGKPAARIDGFRRSIPARLFQALESL
jgi:hypothetical protein